MSAPLLLLLFGKWGCDEISGEGFGVLRRFSWRGDFKTILIPVAKEILGKLGSLALDQIALAWSLRNELEKLKGTVSTIQAVLRDAEEKQGHNPQVKLWLEKLSDVMYDADDLLDDFSTETRRERAARADTTTTTCWTVNEMAHAIRAIREKLDDIKNDREFHLEELAEEQAVPLETDPCPPMIVVGREADRAEIVRHLVHSDGEEANVSVVPIVGMGGLGKTTVAQLVFDDEAVKACFGVRVWVYVSQSFDVKGILEKMLQYMTGESQAGLQLAVLQEKLREKMRAKRFLVVMDDVWEENARGWEDLAKYSMVGAIGSKVLVTTRSSKVAEVGSEIMKSETGGTMLMPYYLGGLSPDESWDLLVRKALHGEVQQSLDVERTGREILKKCCGVPLAISTIAGLLRSKDPKTDWPLFLDDELSNISEGENHIMSTLRLSFNHLPTKLKHCFSYCKLFKKGDALDVQRLHLRFLGLSSWGIKRVPNSITKLINLQVLDLSGCHYIEELPRDVRKLVDLKHIYLHWNVKLTHMPKGIGELTALQTLPVFAVGHKGDEITANGAAGLDELRGLNLLRGELKITNLLHAKPVSSLQLDQIDDLEYLPKEGLRNLTSLQVLEISNCPRLANLSSLCNLTSLQVLVIRNCPRLATLPPANRLTSLENLSIKGCPMLKERCREGEDDEWPSIIDIPSPSPEIRYRRSPLGF
ncbi:unnamed protein product [Linum tenue]|uniref:Disease resistance protein RGA3 n=1 Tax=Linum tenue TaxID=586396 RepID=A0AAV0NPF5_9ROSI|nr:unnamed protein product [Linum tenue]